MNAHKSSVKAFKSPTKASKSSTKGITKVCLRSTIVPLAPLRVLRAWVSGKVRLSSKKLHQGL